jgi:hypothetical protein
VDRQPVREAELNAVANMRITTDDVLRRIDSRRLGPPGFTFPWPATRYIAYGIGAPVVVVCVLVATRVFGDGFWTIVYAASIGVLITSRVMRHIDDERPARRCSGPRSALRGGPVLTAATRSSASTLAASRCSFAPPDLVLAAR